MKYFGNPSKGDILVSVLVFAAIAMTVTIGLTNWGATMLKSIRTLHIREQAGQIAEAGVDYYRWHLAQFPADYKDGTNKPGPYYHDFYNKDGDLIGSYKLTITPPPVGSTRVIINSVGTTTADATASRTIEAILAQPSLAQYAVIANDFLRFGAGTTVYGPVSSNRGIHFDGIAYNLVSSAMATDTDQDNNCTPQPSCAVEWGVFTQSGTDDPSPPTLANNRPDVFVAGRQYPVPGFPFGSLTVSVSNLRTLAAPAGVCAAPGCWTASGFQGYLLHFNNNNTYTMRRVLSLRSAPTNCTNTNPPQNQWGTWSINTFSGGVLGPYAIPANGVIFVDDHVWVEGTINGTRVTVVAGIIGATNPATYPNITVNNDVRYTSYNGTDVIGLIAQGNINVGLVSEDDLQIDAALIAQNGRVGRFYYDNDCTYSGTNYYNRQILTLNGMIATAIRYGFAYTNGTGYQTRNLNYDANLLYSPPPSFPLASSQYQTVSWKQVR